MKEAGASIIPVEQKESCIQLFIIMNGKDRRRAINVVSYLVTPDERRLTCTNLLFSVSSENYSILHMPFTKIVGA